MWSIGAFVTGVLLLAIVLFVPVMHTLFAVETLKAAQIGWIVLLAVIPTALIQAVRVLRFRKDFEKNI